MKRNVILSITVLLLALAFVGGATAAWFYTGTELEPNVFTAGTVKIAIDEGDASCSSDGSFDIMCCPPPPKPRCETVGWTIENIGSKRAYLRVRPEAKATVSEIVYIAIKVSAGGETAWADGWRIPDYCHSWHGSYFAYQLGNYSETKPYSTNLISNGQKVGTVDVWNNGSKLYIDFNTPDGLKEYFIYAGLAIPPGKIGSQCIKHSAYPFKNENIPGKTNYRFNTSYIYEEFGGKKVDVSDLSGGSAPVEVSLYSSSEHNWLKGADGWYYYGDRNGPHKVQPGHEASVQFKFCVDGGNPEMVVSLEAEAVQVTHNAIDHVWQYHPWR